MANGASPFQVHIHLFGAGVPFHDSGHDEKRNAEQYKCRNADIRFKHIQRNGIWKDHQHQRKIPNGIDGEEFAVAACRVIIKLIDDLIAQDRNDLKNQAIGDDIPQL